MKIPTIETEKHIVCQFCILILQLHVLQETWDNSIAETIVLSCLWKQCLCLWQTPGKKVICVNMNANIRISLVFWQRHGRERGKGKMKTVASNVRQYEWGAASLKIPAHSHTMASPGNIYIYLLLLVFFVFEQVHIHCSLWMEIAHIYICVCPCSCSCLDCPKNGIHRTLSMTSCTRQKKKVLRKEFYGS